MGINETLNERLEIRFFVFLVVFLYLCDITFVSVLITITCE